VTSVAWYTSDRVITPTTESCFEYANNVYVGVFKWKKRKAAILPNLIAQAGVPGARGSEKVRPAMQAHGRFCCPFQFS
jgi:hypothetical protein